MLQTGVIRHRRRLQVAAVAVGGYCGSAEVDDFPVSLWYRCADAVPA
jgi:hypothetical protein